MPIQSIRIGIMSSTKLIPASNIPQTTLTDFSGGVLDISDRKNNDSWILIVVYRGLHCLLYANYLSN
jgi:hypothetical protein